MPYSTDSSPPHPSIPRVPKPTKSNPLSRSQQHLHTTFATIQALYTQSQLSQNIAAHITSLHKTARPPIRKILSLGLGSFTTSSKAQRRQLKQLALFLAIRDELGRRGGVGVEVYAQDPVFTKADEAFLSTHSVKILRTGSGTSLGGAGEVIDASTLVYSPFLTLEAYEALLLRRNDVRVFIGDDFDGLAKKWPKFSAEGKVVERVVRGAVRGFMRRVVSGDGYWEEGDGAFGMGVYVREEARRGKARM
ncbi:hypothetical protein CC80DRAFT_266200 [Byssothecium circinans]|uniref:SRR1-like domain-containing protein n=1 Tax=Byssothecium circinans TaxID=147558 RepID=A0A6A5U6W0_9PLEO|nr:hypothetical protein CC80DRAFT_266200 [Byssothecium circinans]